MAEQRREVTRPQRDRHLMDPDVLRRNYEARARAEHAARLAGREVDTRGETVYVTDRAEPPGGMSLDRVRELVVSALVVVTLFHLSVGLAVGGVLSDHRPAQVGLNALAMLTGVLMVAGARLIHGARLLTWWLLLGPLIGIVGLVLALR